MGDVVNLRTARKARKRAAAAVQADANRARFGRIKTERQLAERESDRRSRDLDGARRED